MYLLILAHHQGSPLFRSRPVAGNLNTSTDLGLLACLLACSAKFVSCLVHSTLQGPRALPVSSVRTHKVQHVCVYVCLKLICQDVKCIASAGWTLSIVAFVCGPMVCLVNCTPGRGYFQRYEYTYVRRAGVFAWLPAGARQGYRATAALHW